MEASRYRRLQATLLPLPPVPEGGVVDHSRQVHRKLIDLVRPAGVDSSISLRSTPNGLTVDTSVVDPEQAARFVAWQLRRSTE